MPDLKHLRGHDPPPAPAAVEAAMGGWRRATAMAAAERGREGGAKR